MLSKHCGVSHNITDGRSKPPKQKELLYSEIERLRKTFKGYRFHREVVHSQLKEAKAQEEEV
jgi:hypothetical protein